MTSETWKTQSVYNIDFLLSTVLITFPTFENDSRSTRTPGILLSAAEMYNLVVKKKEYFI